MAEPQSTSAPRAADRRLALAGTYNVRHVGGYASRRGGATANGVLWRGDALHAIDDDARVTLARLPLRTIIDLRDDGERTRMPNRVDGVGASIHTIPMRVYAMALERGADLEAWRRGDLGSFFAILARSRGTQIAAAVNALARPGALPALIHCTAGKDRTGIVMAVLLSALGVADEDVVADFALSERYLDEDFIVHARRALGGAARAGDRVFVAAEPEWIASVLAYLHEEHGSAAAYLDEHGVDPDTLESLRAALLRTDDPPGPARS